MNTELLVNLKPVKRVYKHWLPGKLGASAVTIGHTIYFSMTERFVPDWLHRHENTHIKQINELGVWRFYTQYLLEYLIGRFKGLGHWDAYARISFEIEAVKAEGRSK